MRHCVIFVRQYPTGPTLDQKEPVDTRPSARLCGDVGIFRLFVTAEGHMRSLTREEMAVVAGGSDTFGTITYLNNGMNSQMHTQTVSSGGILHIPANSINSENVVAFPSQKDNSITGKIIGVFGI
jgi:hypothetical protein